jgi:hypothetical protein
MHTKKPACARKHKQSQAHFFARMMRMRWVTAACRFGKCCTNKHEWSVHIRPRPGSGAELRPTRSATTFATKTRLRWRCCRRAVRLTRANLLRTTGCSVGRRSHLHSDVEAHFGTQRSRPNASAVVATAAGGVAAAAAAAVAVACRWWQQQQLRRQLR